MAGWPDGRRGAGGDGGESGDGGDIGGGGIGAEWMGSGERGSGGESYASVVSRGSASRAGSAGSWQVAGRAVGGSEWPAVGDGEEADAEAGECDRAGRRGPIYSPPGGGSRRWWRRAGGGRGEHRDRVQSTRRTGVCRHRRPGGQGVRRGPAETAATGSGIGGEERGEGGADGQAGGGAVAGRGVEGRAVEKPRIRGGDEAEGGIGKAGRGGDGGRRRPAKRRGVTALSGGDGEGGREGGGGEGGRRERGGPGLEWTVWWPLSVSAARAPAVHRRRLTRRGREVAGRRRLCRPARSARGWPSVGLRERRRVGAAMGGSG